MHNECELFMWVAMQHTSEESIRQEMKVGRKLPCTCTAREQGHSLAPRLDNPNGGEGLLLAVELARVCGPLQGLALRPPGHERFGGFGGLEERVSDVRCLFRGFG
eukprot:6197481-Pleurochrysis_carterae.AAC.1